MIDWLLGLPCYVWVIACFISAVVNLYLLNRFLGPDRRSKS